MSIAPLDLDWIRSQFPGLSHRQQERPVAFFDGPAGSQVPSRVGDAVRHYLLHTNSQHGGLFEISRTSDAILDAGHEAVAHFLGSPDPGTIAFGANMTTLTFAVSRALARTWLPGDEIIVTRLDHEGNVGPWKQAAIDAGVIVREIPVRLCDGTLDLRDFHATLSPRTRLVAVGLASNITGTLNPVAEIVAAAHSVGALAYLDAVHYAPHAPLDVTALDADFLVCSAYKFFGPHLGILYGRRNLLESLAPYKLRVATNALPGRWMTGTACHEAIAGVLACLDYLTELGHRVQPGLSAHDRRSALVAALQTIQNYEQELSLRMLAGLARLPRFRVWGITDPSRVAERVPTFSLTHDSLTPAQLALRLAEAGCYAWAGNHYALGFSEAADLEPHGTLRIGLLHYNTAAEVDRVLAELANLG